MNGHVTIQAMPTAKRSKLGCVVNLFVECRMPVNNCNVVMPQLVTPRPSKLREAVKAATKTLRRFLGERGFPSAANVIAIERRHDFSKIRS